MEDKYIYRKHLRQPGKFFMSMMLMFLVPYFLLALELTIANKEERFEMGLVFFIVGIVLVVFIGIEFILIYFIMYKRFKKIYIVLSEDRIIYNNSKGEISVPYEDINNLKFPSIKYIGGWIKIIHGTGNIRLTVVLENIGDMVKNLKSKIDEKNVSCVYNEKAMYNFYKTSKYSDQSWERIYENVKYYFIAILINALVALVISLFVIKVSSKIIITLVAILGPVLIFVIVEIILGRKLAKGSSKDSFSVPERDKHLEGKLYKWAFEIYYVLFIIMAIILIN
ncbi:MAG: hypothetical protein ACERKV_00860 [Clostridiaceae bacterium]